MKNSIREILNKSWPAPFLFRNKNYEAPKIFFVQVDPREILNICMIPEESVLLTGRRARSGLQSGMWDFLKKPFKNHSIYKTVTCILNGRSFEETPLYKKTEKGYSVTQMQNQYKRLLKRIKQLDAEGYKTQYELGKIDQVQKIGKLSVPKHETIIGIDRDGKMMRLVGGRHRLAVAQQIGITSMPAVLSLIHPDASGKLPEKRRMITGDPEDFRPF